MKIIMKCVQYVNCYNYVHHPFLYEKQSLKIVHNDFAISCSLWYYEAVQLHTYIHISIIYITTLSEYVLFLTAWLGEEMNKLTIKLHMLLKAFHNNLDLPIHSLSKPKIVSQLIFILAPHMCSSSIYILTVFLFGVCNSRACILFASYFRYVNFNSWWHYF